MSPANWEDGDVPADDTNGPVNRLTLPDGPVNRLTLPDGPGWPTRLAGYAKLIATAITTLGTTGVLQWLQSAGVTSLPAWAPRGHHRGGRAAHGAVQPPQQGVLTPAP